MNGTRRSTAGCDHCRHKEKKMRPFRRRRKKKKKETEKVQYDLLSKIKSGKKLPIGEFKGLKLSLEGFRCP